MLLYREPKIPVRVVALTLSSVRRIAHVMWLRWEFVYTLHVVHKSASNFPAP